MDTFPPSPDTQCFGMTKANLRCTRTRPEYFEFCEQHVEQQQATELSPDELACLWHGLDLVQVRKFHGTLACRLDREVAEAALGCSVYFLIRGDEIKIGFSKDVQARIKALNHVPSDVLATIPGGRTTESRLHKQFAHLKIRGEWFRAADEILDTIQQELRSAT